MMRFALPLLCAVLLCAAPARAVNFYDDFESGNMSNWTQYPGSDAALAISTDHNKVPAGGQYSAKQDARSGKRRRHRVLPLFRTNIGLSCSRDLDFR